MSTLHTMLHLPGGYQPPLRVLMFCRIPPPSYILFLHYKLTQLCFLFSATLVGECVDRQSSQTPSGMQCRVMLLCLDHERAPSKARRDVSFHLFLAQSRGLPATTKATGCSPAVLRTAIPRHQPLYSARKGHVAGIRARKGHVAGVSCQLQ